MPLRLPDGEPFACYIMLRDDPPRCWTRCEANADEYLTDDEVERFEAWRRDFPRGILSLYPGPVNGGVGVCETHAAVLRQVILPHLGMPS
jgi:hypothetical protein